jgi:hypothetical protein
MRNVRRYGVGEFIESIEERDFVQWDSRFIQGIGFVEDTRCNILQRVTRNLRDTEAWD